VVAVHESVGQRVAQGAALVTVEAMKMEHTLTAPREGVVERVVYAPGEKVAAGDNLIEMSEERG
jgi:3-methylcrotonyl-CoA carboxylase alpha subunit